MRRTRNWINGAAGPAGAGSFAQSALSERRLVSLAQANFGLTPTSDRVSSAENFQELQELPKSLRRV